MLLIWKVAARLRKSVSWMNHARQDGPGRATSRSATRSGIDPKMSTHGSKRKRAPKSGTSTGANRRPRRWPPTSLTSSVGDHPTENEKSRRGKAPALQIGVDITSETEEFKGRKGRGQAEVRRDLKPDSTSAQHEWIDTHRQLVASMLLRWSEGNRPPHLQRAVRADAPTATMQEFNAAAEVAWARISRAEWGTP